MDLVPMAKKILEDAQARGVQVVLPEDVVAAMDPRDRDRIRTVPADRIPVGMAGLDIGPATVMRFGHALRDAGTVVWNGPMGMVEQTAFASGTEKLAKVVADCGVLTVAGGGDTVAAIHRAGVADRLGYLSPSGAAFLAALEGRELPGVAALSDMTARPLAAVR
jgi:phosphoglycerate kinase